MPVKFEVVESEKLSEDRYERATWRAVIHAPGAGAWNMAVDEALVEAVAGGASPPTLRLFAWEPPCLSLGQAQPVTDVDPARLAERGWDVVRRITGGRAILHTDELTYSVVVPDGDPRVAGGVVESYRRLSAGLLAGLARLGAGVAGHAGIVGAGGETKGPVCFEVPSNYEITALGKKLLGSAQTRRKGVVLQHGALPLFGDLGRICDALAFASEAERQEASDRVRSRAATLEEVLGRRVTFDEAATAMRDGFGAALNLDLEANQLSEAEVARAEALLVEKYAAEAWTARV